MRPLGFALRAKKWELGTWTGIWPLEMGGAIFRVGIRPSFTLLNLVRCTFFNGYK